MHPIFYYIFCYLFLGVIGMYLGNRKVNAPTGKNRWKKLLIYIVIVNLLIFSMLLGYFWIISIIIISVGFLEVSRQLKYNFLSLVIVVSYLWISWGFLQFGIRTTSQFQLFIYFQVFSFDGFSQVTGQLFGKTPLSPKISPKKTLEGFTGGLLFCVLSSIIARFWISCSISTAFFWGIFTGILCISGDLGASSIKRIYNLKDFSRLIPAHGGILDRFDSLLMTGMAYYWVLYSHT